MPRALLIHPEDNVAVALEEITENAAVVIQGGGSPIGLMAAQTIPFAHKVAVREIQRGEAIRKYGVAVAVATTRIDRGQWVHTHNAQSRALAGSQASQ